MAIKDAADSWTTFLWNQLFPRGGFRLLLHMLAERVNDIVRKRPIGFVGELLQFGLQLVVQPDVSDLQALSWHASILAMPH